MRTAFVLMALAACGSSHTTNIKSTLRLADQDDATIGRLISAAGGTEMFAAESQIDQFSSNDQPGFEDPCPALTVAGSTITLTGGCTTKDMVQVDGTATVTNGAAWDLTTYNFQNDTTYTMQGFTLTQSGFTQSFDGRISLEDSMQTYDADVTVDQLGAAVRTDIYMSCSRDGTTVSCDLEGSGLELVGVGGVTLSGTVAAGQGASGSFTLHGVDTLTATISSGCVAWQINGTDRQKVCQ
jgi:hypothetical protein